MWWRNVQREKLRIFHFVLAQKFYFIFLFAFATIDPALAASFGSNHYKYCILCKKKHFGNFVSFPQTEKNNRWTKWKTALGNLVGPVTMEQTKNYRICDSWLASNHSRDNPSFLQEPMKIQPDFGPKTTHFVALCQKRRFNEIQSTNNTLENINKSILECEKKLKKLKEQKEHLLSTQPPPKKKKKQKKKKY